MRQEKFNFNKKLILPPKSRVLLPSSAEEIAMLTRKNFDEDGIMARSMIDQAINYLDQQMQSTAGNCSADTFERSDYSAIRSFFDEAAEDYDSDLENPYFSFSHEVLKYILTTFINNHFSPGQSIRMFDAGAGTGNWSKFVLSFSDAMSATLFDMNPSMLEKARRKLGSLIGQFVKIIEGNLEILSDYPAEKSNLILCLHNVIGMGRNIPLILSNLNQHLEVGGLAFIMTPNKYQAFDFTQKFRGQMEASRVVRDGSVKYRDDMPEMFCYTPKEFQEMLFAAGFDEVTVLGYPITVQPVLGDEQLQQRNTSTQQLKDPKSRAQLLELEKYLCLNPELAYRGGSSLIAICKKTRNAENF
jgi:ubiquinone/menaquinone biosynthesis C-methylase UbiE